MLRLDTQDRRRLPTDHAVSDGLDGDITTQLAMALHQVAKEPLLSVGNTVLPTVPIVPRVVGDTPTTGAWGGGGGGGASDPLSSGGELQPTQPFTPQSAANAPTDSAPTGGQQGARDPLIQSAAGDGGSASPLSAAAGPSGISSSLQHATNDPSLARSTAVAPSTPFVAQPADGSVAEASALSSITSRDPMMAAGSTNVPTTPFVPQSAAAAAGSGGAAGGAPGSSTLPMQLHQAVIPTTVQMPLASANAGEGLPETFWSAPAEAQAGRAVAREWSSLTYTREPRAM